MFWVNHQLGLIPEVSLTKYNSYIYVFVLQKWDFVNTVILSRWIILNLMRVLFQLIKVNYGYNDRRISWLRLFHSAKQKSYIMHVFYRSEILSTTWFSQVWSNLNIVSFSFQLTWIIGTMIVASTDLHLNPVTIAAGIPSHGFYSLISSVSFIASLILSIESIWANEWLENVQEALYSIIVLLFSIRFGQLWQMNISDWWLQIFAYYFSLLSSEKSGHCHIENLFRKQTNYQDQFP